MAEQIVSSNFYDVSFLLIISILAPIKGSQIEMSTSTEWSMKALPINVIHTREQHWMTFQVKTSGEVYVGLMTFYDNLDDSFEVYINSNGYCGLKGGGPGYLARQSCSGVVSSAEYRPFWVSWEGGIVAAGTGKRVGENVIVSLNDPIDVAAHYLSITGYDAVVQWRIGSQIEMSTNTGWLMKALPINAIHTREQHWMTFQVKTSGEVYVGLMTFYDNLDDSFEVYINSNGYCGLKGGGPGYLARQSCSGVVSSAEYRPFWVSWEGGIVAAGTGKRVGENVIVSLNDPIDVAAHYLSITGYDAVVQWRIDTSAQLCLFHKSFKLLKSQDIYNPDPRMITRTESSLTRTCCSNACWRLIWCRGFSYKTTMQECRMFDTAPQVQDLTSAAGWETYG